MTVNFLPVMIVDVGGALMMIALSFMCVNYAVRLKYRDPQNIVWAYLLWVCLALAVFAVSRSAGHIVKQLLIITDHAGWWTPLRPYSGAINSFTFFVVGAVTLFFERTWTIYQGIVRDRQALQQAHQELLYLNQNLEKVVGERTAALTLSEQKYRRIFEESKDMIVSTDMDGRVLDLNPAGLRMLGLSAMAPLPEARLPDFLFDVVIWQNLMSEIQLQGFVSSVELDMKGGNGICKRVLLSGSLATGGTANDHTIHFLVKDIEQQHLMREQMAQADKLASIGELSAGVAHEINNPMGIILGYTQLLMRHEDGDSQRREDLKTIEKHVLHCKSIVEDLLNFARTSSPKKALCDIHQIIDDVVHFIQQHVNPGGIDIQKSYDRDLGPLLVDEKKIKQVLINLIMNAKHAIGRQGTIIIRTGRTQCNGKALISVQDTGSGIEKKNLSRIFDPFFTTKPTGQGTGLGLSVSYGIVKNHGGEIKVESRRGQGSTFSVVLPVPKVAAER